MIDRCFSLCAVGIHYALLGYVNAKTLEKQANQKKKKKMVRNLLSFDPEEPLT